MTSRNFGRRDFMSANPQSVPTSASRLRVLSITRLTSRPWRTRCRLATFSAAARSSTVIPPAGGTERALAVGQ